MSLPTLPAADLERYLLDCHEMVIDEIRDIIPSDVPDAGQLYELMLDYPLREAKALRPALCIAACRALGGHLQAVLPSAAVLELYHNAFLIHDDIEDNSLMRRKGETLHRQHGVPIAINVGDGMLALALGPLLDNMRVVGMGRALRVLETVGEMARTSAEGQAMELRWIREARFDLLDRDYIRMAYKKSAWYTFVTPITVGVIIAGAPNAQLYAMRRFAILLGIAFQIQDDVLNLEGDVAEYGKEIDGDLWEGKHTLILIHALRNATPAERERAHTILRKRRPDDESSAEHDVRTFPDDLVRRGELSERGRDRMLRMLVRADGSGEPKSTDDVAFLRQLVDQRGSVEYARAAAVARARRARRTLDKLAEQLPETVHVAFLAGLISFVLERNR